MSNRVAIVTIAAKNFLAPARALAASLREHHPDAPFYLLLADEPGGLFTPAREPFHVLGPADLGLPDARAFLFGFNRLEVCVATKPWLIGGLLDEGYDAVVYLDADMLVTGELSGLLEAAVSHPVSLTPHRLSPAPEPGGAEAEALFLRHGAFNAGLVAVSAADEGRRFLGWWRDRVYADSAAGVFHDQQWLDFAPALFDGVAVLRDPGLNVAYWNLAERGLAVLGAEPRVGGEPCRIVHFSGYNGAPAGGLSAHSPLRLSGIGSAAVLFERYATMLAKAGYPRLKNAPYAYDRFSDGSPIPQPARLIYRLEGGGDRPGDPFDADGATVAWLNAVADPATPGLSRFWRGVRELRPDLQRAFPDLGGKHLARYLAWTRETGRREHAVPEILWG